MRRTFATHLYEQTGDIRLTADALPTAQLIQPQNITQDQV